MERDVAGLRAEAPSQEEGLLIVQRLREGDPVASNDFAAAYLGSLGRTLRRYFPGDDTADVETAAEDAIWSFILEPDTYDASLITIVSYLTMAAKRDLENIRNKEFRHGKRRAGWGEREEDVELPSRVENIQGSELDDPARIAELNETIAEKMAVLRRRVAAVDEDLSPGEIDALLLVMDGERKTERFAEALGITHLPLAEQRREVKRFKDRMGKRLVRSGVDDA
jgi:hypothetical protein